MSPSLVYATLQMQTLAVQIPSSPDLDPLSQDNRNSKAEPFLLQQVRGLHVLRSVNAEDRMQQ